jgi:hypothetical protein
MLRFEPWENTNFCQKFGKSASEMFKVIKQAYGEEAFSHSAELSGINILHRAQAVWKMMSITG